MNTPIGTKRVTSIVMIFLPVLLGFFGYRLSDGAPIEIARFIDVGWNAVWGLFLIYGEYKAKGVLWFAKINK